MKKLNHTPGPWAVAVYRKDPKISPTVEEIKEWLCETVDNTIKHGGSVENFYGVFSSLDPEDTVYMAIVGNGPTSEANSHLISMAPEMLEGLIYFVKRVREGSIRSKKTYAKYITIIERATGISIDKILQQ